MWNCFLPKWCHIDLSENDYCFIIQIISTEITSPFPHQYTRCFRLYIKLFVAFNSNTMYMYTNKDTHWKNTGLENYQQTQILLPHFTIKYEEEKNRIPSFYQLIVRMSCIHLIFCLFASLYVPDFIFFPLFIYFLFSLLVPSMFESETYKLLLCLKAHTKKKLPLRHTHTCTNFLFCHRVSRIEENYYCEKVEGKKRKSGTNKLLFLAAAPFCVWNIL